MSSTELTIPGSDIVLTDGSIVILARFPGTKWVVHNGWYTYHGRSFQGWYFCSIPAKTTIPVSSQDLAGIIVISDEGAPIEPDCPCPPYPPPGPYPPGPYPPGPYPPGPYPPPVPPIPPGPYPPGPDGPAYISRREKARYEAAFISVPLLKDRDELQKNKIPDGKIVRVNSVDGVPKYYLWDKYNYTWKDLYIASDADLQELEQELKTYTDDAVASIDVPVKGIVEGEKVLSLVGTDLETELAIDTSKDATTGITYVVLKGKNGEVISSFDASMFMSGGVLQSVEIVSKPVGQEVHQFLVMTFLLEDGTTKTVEADLQSLIDVYKAAEDGGLVLDPATNEFSIKNQVTPSSGVNVDQTASFGGELVLHTITYDEHGLITGQTDFTITLPDLSGSIGTEGDTIITDVALGNDGVLTGHYKYVSTQIVDSATDDWIPTSKAVHDAINDAAPRWTVL